jgi:hypothetical protein
MQPMFICLAEFLPGHPPPSTGSGQTLRKNAKERGTHCVGNARKIKSPGHPAVMVFFHTLP